VELHGLPLLLEELKEIATVPLTPLFRSLALGAVLGVGGWQGVHYLLRQSEPVRLLEWARAKAPAEARSGVTVVFLFRPEECPKLMSVIELLNEVRPERARVVGALMVDAYRFPEWRALIAAEQIRFPVDRIDPGPARGALRPLGYAGGPLLLVFDAQGRVILATDALGDRHLGPLLDRVIDGVTASAARRIRV
jgi:hypothetical protein